MGHTGCFKFNHIRCFNHTRYFNHTGCFSSTRCFTHIGCFSHTGCFNPTRCFKYSGWFNHIGCFNLTRYFNHTGCFNSTRCFIHIGCFNHTGCFNPTRWFKYSGCFNHIGCFTHTGCFNLSLIFSSTDCCVLPIEFWLLSSVSGKTGFPFSGLWWSATLLRQQSWPATTILWQQQTTVLLPTPQPTVFQTKAAQTTPGTTAEVVFFEQWADCARWLYGDGIGVHWRERPSVLSNLPCKTKFKGTGGIPLPRDSAH